MDFSDPKFSFDIIDQPSDAAPGSTVTENCKHDCNTTTSEDVTFSPAATYREMKEVYEEEGWIIVSSDENDAQQRASMSSNECQKIDSEIHEYQALRNQNQDSMTENVEARQALLKNQSSYLHLGSVQTEKQNEISIKAAAALSKKPVLKEAGKSPEALLHHGLLRRSLQLEDTSYTIVSLPAQSPSNSRGLISPLETPCTPIKGKETEKIQASYPQNRNDTANIPKPSGIGLHLNSIINVLQTGSGAVVHTKSAQTFNFSVRGKKPTPTNDSHLSDTSKTNAVFTDDSGPEIHASEAVNSVAYLPTTTITSSNNPEDDHSAQGDKSLYTNIESDGISEDIKSNPKKKRKRFDYSDGDGDGCKRCHCRKSKCLKLYCDCFAAGLYCAGSCACQGCYNRPEYEDKVIEARQQIESRNPLAFAPKIVKHSVKPPASISGEDETHFTPSSARHKRGCNCKKSMCLKKYCECYHANVGCSDGCRCEGCKNVYGLKGEYSLDKDSLSSEDITEITDASFLEMMSYGNDNLCHSQLTPRTPAVQFKKDVREGRLRPRQCFQSPESGVTFATPNAMTPMSPLISDNDTMILESSQEALNQASPIRELYYDNVETQGELKLSNLMQDDTPDILKESPVPINAVKSSSPNKKRVSPPHAPRHEFGLRSLNGLRNGRKFILKAVPSIPSSTDARRGGPQGKTGPQD